jgi:hypothetical protein
MDPEIENITTMPRIYAFQLLEYLEAEAAGGSVATMNDFFRVWQTCEWCVLCVLHYTLTMHYAVLTLVYRTLCYYLSYYLSYYLYYRSISTLERKRRFALYEEAQCRTRESLGWPVGEVIPIKAYTMRDGKQWSVYSQCIVNE